MKAKILIAEDDPNIRAGLIATLESEGYAVTAASESFLFTLNPRMSYVSKEFAAVDSEFWIPKPPKPATVPGLTTPPTVPQPGPTTPPAPKP